MSNTDDWEELMNVDKPQSSPIIDKETLLFAIKAINTNKNRRIEFSEFKSITTLYENVIKESKIVLDKGRTWIPYGIITLIDDTYLEFEIIENEETQNDPEFEY